MNAPTLYQEYTPDEALRLFGSIRRKRSHCNGQWIILQDVVLAFVRLGEPPSCSHFETGSRFCWVADQPYVAARDGGSAPSEVRSDRRKDRPIYLFAQSDVGSDRYTYVGCLDAAYAHGVRTGAGYGLAHFHLRPTLPSAVWRRLGGTGGDDVIEGEIDPILERLKLPLTTEERLAILDAVATYWHGPGKPGDWVDASELQSKELPRPLRHWYERYGRREHILRCQNRLRSVDELEIEDGRMVFYIENQAVYLWSTATEGDDPPVWGCRNEEEPWTEEEGTLSSFLIQALLFEAIIGAPYGASEAWLDGPTLSRLIDAMPPLSLGAWRWPSHPSKFYGRGGAFMFAAPNTGYEGEMTYSAYIGAKTEHPLQFLKSIEGVPWVFAAF